MQAGPGVQAVRPFKLRKSLGMGRCGGGTGAAGGARVTLVLSPAQPPGGRRWPESGPSSPQRSR